MSGSSSRDDAANQLNSELAGYQNQINNINPNVENRFNDYQDQFNAGSFQSTLDRINQSALGAINRRTNEAVSRGQANTAARLASQGITGGSILNSGVQQAADSANEGGFEATQQQGANYLGRYYDMMNQLNANKFRNTSAAQGADQQNYSNLMAKYGLKSGAYGQQMSNLGNLSDKTWLDDTLGVVNTAANLGGSIMGIPGVMPKATPGGGVPRFDEYMSGKGYK